MDRPVDALPRNIRSIISFLRGHAPFSNMDDRHLALFAEHSTLVFFASDEVILSPDDGPANTFNVVKQGRVTGQRPNTQSGQFETTFEIGIGECFPVAALLGERPTRTLHRAARDTFCLSLDHSGFVRLFTESEIFRDFCLRGVSSLLDQVNRHIQSGAMAAMGTGVTLDTPLEQFARRNPIVCSPDLPIHRAVARMHDARVSSLIVTDDRRYPIGIFTLRDLRSLIAEGRPSLTAPVGQAMTAAPKCLDADTPAFDAALLMAEHHIAHVGVVDEEGQLTGVVSERDLFGQQRIDLVQLARAIATAPHLAALIRLRADVSRLVDRLLAHGTGSGQVVKMITTLNDLTVRRVLEINRLRNDPGVPFTWLAFDSDGRQEQTLLTAQTNGILFQTPGGMSTDHARHRLLPFARQINEDLADCGFPRPANDLLAGNPPHCLSRTEWDEVFAGYIVGGSPRVRSESPALFDMRAIYGAAEPVVDLATRNAHRLHRNPSFLKQLASEALSRRPPLMLFYDGPDAAGPDNALLDLRAQGLALFVDAVRTLALGHGIDTPNTLARLEQLTHETVLEGRDAAAWKEAYGLIQLIRMRHHQDQLNRGQSLTDTLDPDHLTPLDRRILRESLRQAQRLQQKLAHSYGL